MNKTHKPTFFQEASSGYFEHPYQGETDHLSPGEMAYGGMAYAGDMHARHAYTRAGIYPGRFSGVGGLPYDPRTPSGARFVPQQWYVQTPQGQMVYGYEPHFFAPQWEDMRYGPYPHPPYPMPDLSKANDSMKLNGI